MPFTRIAITLPPNVLASLDARARELDRSRSRVIVDAIRAFLERPPAVREPGVSAYGAEAVARARSDQLERDLARTPAERLHSAEQAARLARQAHPRQSSRQQIISFDSYEDFYEWKKTNRA